MRRAGTRAREELILSRRTHLDQLAHKLEEARVRRVVEPMLSGGEVRHQVRDLEYRHRPPPHLRRPRRHGPTRRDHARSPDARTGLAATVLTHEGGDFNDDLAALGPDGLAARLAPLLGPGVVASRAFHEMGARRRLRGVARQRIPI